MKQMVWSMVYGHRASDIGHIHYDIRMNVKMPKICSEIARLMKFLSFGVAYAVSSFGHRLSVCFERERKMFDIRWIAKR